MTYSLSFPGGPSSVAAYLRARWSLGSVQQRYVFEGEGSDQHCGRTVAGLPLSSVKFAVLPPRFDKNVCLDDETWAQVHPEFHAFPPAFKEVMPYLLATLVHHRTFLRTNLAADHPLFQTYLWTSGLIDRFGGHVLVGEKKCEVTGLVATGVPQHVVIMHELVSVVEKLKILNESLKNAQEALMQRLTSLGDDLPANLSKHILNNFEVNGAVPITFGQVEGLFDRFKEQLLSQIASLSVPSKDGESGESASQPPNASPAKKFTWKLWKSGEWHPVPEGFIFPSVTASTLWNFWFLGNDAEDIGPYMKIRKRDLGSAGQKTQLSRAKKVICGILDGAKAVGAVEPSFQEHDLKDADPTEVRRVFEAGFAGMVSLIETTLPKRKTQSRRWGELQYSSLYDDVAALDRVTFNKL